MTTIAFNYKDGEIAIDSRTSCGSTIVSDNTNKVIKRNGFTFIGCGAVPDINKMADAYPKGVEGDANLDVTMYVIDNVKVIRCGQSVDEGFWFNEVITNRAEGSGADFALAAMDFGKSAREAVKYASTRDLYTGGKIRVVKVAK